MLGKPQTPWPAPVEVLCTNLHTEVHPCPVSAAVTRTIPDTRLTPLATCWASAQTCRRNSNRRHWAMEPPLAYEMLGCMRSAHAHNRNIHVISCVHIRTYLCVYISVCVYIYTYWYLHTYIHIYVRTFNCWLPSLLMYPSSAWCGWGMGTASTDVDTVHFCVCVYIYSCIRIHTYIYIYIYIYTYIHI